MYSDKCCNCCWSVSKTYIREKTKKSAPHCVDCATKYTAKERESRIFNNMYNKTITAFQGDKTIEENITKINNMEAE